MRARSNNPRFPWQAPRPTLSYWLTGTKECSETTAIHSSTMHPNAHRDQTGFFPAHDGRCAAPVTELKGYAWGAAPG